jgi:hypothetical protein
MGESIRITDILQKTWCAVTATHFLGDSVVTYPFNLAVTGQNLYTVITLALVNDFPLHSCGFFSPSLIFPQGRDYLPTSPHFSLSFFFAVNREKIIHLS